MADNEMPKKTFGWKRFFRYRYFKLLRTNDNPRSIAMGVGLGLFIGFLIPIGFQTIVAFPMAFLFKANKILAVSFTWVTNYVTVFFIYPIQCYIGGLIIFRPIELSALRSTFKVALGTIKEISKECGFWESFYKTIQVFLNLGSDIVITFIVGGLLFGLISGIAGYCLTYGAVIRYKESRRQKMRQKLMSKREH